MYVAQDDLEHVILLPQFPECWNYKCGTHAWLLCGVGASNRALHILDKHSTNCYSLSYIKHLEVTNLCGV